jgi:hypothetical protein
MPSPTWIRKMFGGRRVHYDRCDKSVMWYEMRDRDKRNIFMSGTTKTALKTMQVSFVFKRYHSIQKMDLNIQR